MAVPLRLGEPPDGQVYVFAQGSGSSNVDIWEAQMQTFGPCAAGSFSPPGQNLSGLSSWTDFVAQPWGVYWSWRPLAAGANTSDLTQGRTLRAFAQGYRDAHTLQQLGHMRAARPFGFLRPWWEFNGNWTEAVDGSWGWQPRENDTSRVHTDPADAVGAFRRLKILMRGGTRAHVNAQLAAVGLPALRDGGSGDIPETTWALLWCPHRSPSPSISVEPRNDPRLWWPGAGWPDGVSMDAYSKFGYSSVWNAAYGPKWLIDTYCLPGTVDPDGTPRELPFYWGELGTRGTDDAAWHNSMFNDVEAITKIKGVTYFQYPASDGDSFIDNSRNTATRGVWRNRIGSAPTIYITDPADFRDYRGDTPGGPTTPPAGLPAFGYSTPGAGWANIGDGWKYAQRVTLPIGAVGAVSAHLRGQAGSVGQPVRAWIVAEGETGNPTELLGISAAATVAVNQPAGAVTFTFPNPVEITEAGTYRLALVGDTPGAVAQYNYTDGAGTFLYGNTPGAADTAQVGDDFGAVTNTLTRAMTILAVPAAGDAASGVGEAPLAVGLEVVLRAVAPGGGIDPRLIRHRRVPAPPPPDPEFYVQGNPGRLVHRVGGVWSYIDEED